MDYKASTQTNVKLKNQRIILNLLLNEGQMTRAELAKKMNSSKPTVSKNVEDLLNDKKIREVGKDDNLIGKKGTLLDINADYGHVLAIDLSKNKFRVAVANLKMERIHYFSESIDHYFTDESLEQVNVLKLLNEFLKKEQVDIKKLLIATIAFPGVVGHNDLVYLTNMKFREVLLNQLTPYIKNDLGIQLIVKNDINLATVAEKRYGNYADVKNLYLLSADVGVGVGIIINHQLYEGDRNAAGEVGFVLPVQHKDGRYYTLEERIGVHTILKRFLEKRSKDGDDEISFKNRPEEDFDFLLKGIESGDPVASEIYEEVLEDVAVAITNIASVLDIKHVVVDGRMFKLKSNMLEDLNRLVSRMTPFDTLVSYSTQEGVSLQGAIVVGAQTLISSLV